MVFTRFMSISVLNLVKTVVFFQVSMDISGITYMMECSEKTARKILADAGPILNTSKDGRKLIWHINLDTFSASPSANF